MNVIETSFLGLFVLEVVDFQDNRGGFRKIFNSELFKKYGLETEYKEFYYSVSHKNVIRGMHFQLPPFDHIKLVYVSKGCIKDVVVDLRKESPTYRQCFSIELNENVARYLYIPRGFAHGFLSLEEGSIVNYFQTSCYSKECDCGIAYDSIGFDWKVSDAEISDRDLNHVSLCDFISPF